MYCILYGISRILYCAKKSGFGLLAQGYNNPECFGPLSVESLSHSTSTDAKSPAVEKERDKVGGGAARAAAPEKTREERGREDTLFPRGAFRVVEVE